RMVVTVHAGAVEGGATTLTVEPDAADRPLVNRTVTGPAGSMPLLWPEQRPGEPFLTVAGTIPAGAAPAHLAVSAGNPTRWFAAVLRHRLVEAGIEVTGEAVDVDELSPKPDRTTAT